MEILITDLTYMKNGVCIAGIDINTGTNVRPVLSFGLIQKDYVEEKNIIPCAIVKFNLFPKKNIVKPHIEDFIFIPEDTRFVRAVTQREWVDYLERYSSNSLNLAFNNCIVNNKGIPPQSDCGSLAILRTQQPIRVDFFNSDYGATMPFKCRVSFSCDGSSYHLPATDLQFIDYCIERFDKGDSRQTVKTEIERVINNSGYIYLKIGLTRPFKKADDATELCYLQVNGIYTEVLDGMIRSFARELAEDRQSAQITKTSSLQFRIFNIPLQNAEDPLLELNDFLRDIDVKRVFANVVNDDFWSVLVGYVAHDYKQENDKQEKLLCESLLKLTEHEKTVYEHLRQWRSEKSKSLGFPEYMVLSNKSLMSIAKFRPKTPEELLRIYGIGEKKVMDYGKDIITLLCNKFIGE